MTDSFPSASANGAAAVAVKCLALCQQPFAKQNATRWLDPFKHQPVFVKTPQELLLHPLLEQTPLILIHVTDIEVLEVCRELRARPQTALIPQVLIVNDFSLRAAAYEAGAEAVFARGARYQDITARLEVLLAQRSKVADLGIAAAKPAPDREQLRLIASRHMAPHVVDQLLNHPEALRSLNSAVSTHAAVLFADMRGFTGMSERLKPAQVLDLLNEFFSQLTMIVFKHEGAVFSMAGDCLMAGFGVPYPQADAGLRAMRAAREMLTAFQSMSMSWLHRNGCRTGLGIGINEGEVIAGNIGGERCPHYTLIGDTVNVAARLCQRARAGEVLFSGALKLSLDKASAELHAPSEVPLLALPALTLRGREAPVDIYCVPSERQRLVLAH